jgi:hypothetical protein
MWRGQTGSSVEQPRIMARAHFHASHLLTFAVPDRRTTRETGVVTTRREGMALMNTLRSDDLEATFPGLLAVFSADPFVSIARSGLAATNCAGGTDTSQ